MKQARLKNTKNKMKIKLKDKKNKMKFIIWWTLTETDLS